MGGGITFGNTGVGFGNTKSPNVTIDASGEQDAIALPVGNTAQRPTGKTGYFRFNTDKATPEYYSSQWMVLGGILVQNNNVDVNSVSIIDFANGNHVLMNVIDDHANNRVLVWLDSIGGGGGGTVNVGSNGTYDNAAANVNFLNTTTVNVAVQANTGNTANVVIDANVTAISGPAYAQANAAYSQANTANSVAQLAYSQANASANTVAIYDNEVLVKESTYLNLVDSSTINAFAVVNTSFAGVNVSYSVNTSANYNWNGSHTFQQKTTFSGGISSTDVYAANSVQTPNIFLGQARSIANAGVGIGVVSGYPEIVFYDPAAPANNKIWEFIYQPNALLFRTITDDYNTSTGNFLSASRANSNITQVIIGNDVDYPTIYNYGYIAQKDNTSGSAMISQTYPGGAANNKLWTMRDLGSSYEFTAWDDTFSFQSKWLQISRYNSAGAYNVASITFGNSTDYPSHTFWGDVTINLNGSGGAPQGFFANSVANTAGGLWCQTNGYARWLIGKNQNAESGANAGSDFGIFAYSDSGVYIGSPILITRSTINVNVANNLGVSNNIQFSGNLVSAIGNVPLQVISGNTSNVVVTVAANGAAVIDTRLATGGGGSSNTTIISYQNTATTNQTSFVLSVNVASDVLAIVNKNGLLQEPGTHYTIANNVLTFSSNCANNDLIEARIFQTNGAMQISGVGGNPYNIQYNNNGILGGTAGLSFNPQSNAVTANGQVRGVSFASTYANNGSVSANVYIDCNTRGMADLTLTGNCNVWFQNCAAAGYLHTVVVLVRQSANGGNTINWQNTIRWSDNNIPVLSSTANTMDGFTFITYDGGTIWIGAQVYGNVPLANIY